MRNEKGMGLFTSLSLSYKACLEKFLFWSDPLNLEIVKRQRQNQQNTQFISRMKRDF